MLLALAAMYTGKRLQVLILGRTHDGGELPSVTSTTALLHGTYTLVAVAVRRLSVACRTEHIVWQPRPSLWTYTATRC